MSQEPQVLGFRIPTSKKRLRLPILLGGSRPWPFVMQSSSRPHLIRTFLERPIPNKGHLRAVYNIRHHRFKSLCISWILSGVPMVVNLSGITEVTGLITD